MTIRKATPLDIDTIMPIYDQARQRMRSAGNMVQWIDGYPQRELILQAIAEGTHYVCEEASSLMAVFTLIFGDDPTYRVIEGAWPNDKPYATIHRIAATAPGHQVLHHVVQWALTQTDNLRIDTHADNALMLQLLEREGFRYCGIIHVANGTPRKAFQIVR